MKIKSVNLWIFLAAIFVVTFITTTGYAQLKQRKMKPNQNKQKVMNQSQNTQPKPETIFLKVQKVKNEPLGIQKKVTTKDMNIIKEIPPTADRSKFCSAEFVNKTKSLVKVFVTDTNSRWDEKTKSFKETDMYVETLSPQSLTKVYLAPTTIDFYGGSLYPAGSGGGTIFNGLSSYYLHWEQNGVPCRPNRNLRFLMRPY